MKEKFDPLEIGVMIIAAVFVLVIVIAVVVSKGNRSPKVETNSSWSDPGISNSGSAEWPYYGKSTSQLIKELKKGYENYAVTSSREQSLYAKIGGMYSGRRKGPQFYDYDFLEVPISMTLVMKNGQRYYLTFQKGGVKEGDPRLY